LPQSYIIPNQDNICIKIGLTHVRAETAKRTKTALISLLSLSSLCDIIHTRINALQRSNVEYRNISLYDGDIAYDYPEVQISTYISPDYRQYKHYLIDYSLHVTNDNISGLNLLR